MAVEFAPTEAGRWRVGWHWHGTVALWTQVRLHAAHVWVRRDVMRSAVVVNAADSHTPCCVNLAVDRDVPVVVQAVVCNSAVHHNAPTRTALLGTGARH